MTCLSKLPALMVLFALNACSSNIPPLAQTHSTDRVTAIQKVHEPAHEAMLLVSMDNGTVVKQTVNIDADVCFKQNSASSTTCFSQGSAIIDPSTNAVIGYEMIEDHIDLIAKTD